LGLLIASCGKSAGLNTTSPWPGARVTVFSTATVSKAARTVAWTGAAVRFSTGTPISTSATLLSALGKVVTTWVSPIRTGPVEVSTTSCHRPVLRSRTLGIQSQPSLAMKVGPSRACMPPFSPTPAVRLSSWARPGCGGGETLTATALTPGFSLPVTSNRPRMKAPFSAPSFSPFSQTSAA
jgi:hypothetical protein